MFSQWAERLYANLISTVYLMESRADEMVGIRVESHARYNSLSYTRESESYLRSEWKLPELNFLQ